ncbi:phospho-N-acetylmuramoyl-pentapeptide-transferase [Clostridium botulinum]|uniref:Phospho-N-acetylmuramoyl-pentapeptide-transferase n=1 Tax=Clostridium botulinum (strain Hall / ATCC 3502 / NCTC 13319 / Type A) TaxID=441771 RepID=A5I076_CLOBH|nr:phospho-N-acetylmuramoyl-pentapeptide-transferase [Clostridium botulinum]ABS33107.1 phospho-N-acetylmuramoyl-pentapeptide-transferase [Clostridium botulinum A str. ATCC 19397]ABS37227.1 phospho-N-acetylmuramoyl-pentapeptide-transferase [Clostridium botulinum A str. Hall]APQ73364.1 phospho-N-acetylmuramoyl-pentapeptide-transferase [Clostridium botulinum]AUM87040.1 phospho-N-acetylmuramoyl-pentapeptide-transferase [Clostridium botulinum]AUN09847.1 phospho-N-acetylmuramoyl-pentapeptide-transfe
MSTIIYAVLFSFLLSTITSLFLIPLFKKLNLGQSIKNGIPISHKKKAGTPTFGGIIFIFSSIITMLFIIKNYNKELLLVISSLIAFGLIGFIDDTLKKIHKKNEGLTSKGKMILLLFVSSIFAIYSYYNPSIGSIIMFPFTKKLFDLRILYIPFIIFYYVSTTNALNLTDGLDGLATSITLLVVTFFIFLSFGMGHYTLSISCGCIAGALLGFLRYNCYPAKIIMGDTGSLALGGAIATIAMILKNPFIVIIVGGIYVIEALSSLIQIVFFKLFGKRIFKMAPIHHSLELHGWHETKIVSVFSIITTILCLIGFLSM